MNKEDLLQAFGEIDDEIFGAELDNPEEAVKPVFVTPQKAKRSKKPFFIAASAVAACGALVLGIGLASRGNDVPAPQTAVYKPSEIFPNLNFEERYSEIYNAEDLYLVQRTEINADMWRKYGMPALICGDKLFFAYNAKSENSENEEKTELVVICDNLTKEEEILNPYITENEEDKFEFILAGIYNDFLYFFRREKSEQKEYSDEITDFCRLNLKDYNTFEVMISFKGDYFYYSTILSKDKKYLYFFSMRDLDDYGTYRIDLASGKSDLYIDSALSPMAYKDGIVYLKDDENYYYHSPEESEDTVLFPDEYEDLKVISGDRFLFIRGTEGEKDEHKIRELGIKDENGERTLIIEGDGDSLVDLTYDFLCSESGLNLGRTYNFDEPLIQNKPLIYDQVLDKFSFVNLKGGKSSLPFSPLGFIDNGSVSFIDASYGDDGNYSKVELVTISRKEENTDNSKEDNKLIELPSIEELYDVRKYEFYSDGGNYEGFNLETAVFALKNEVYFGKVWLYDFKLFVTDGVNVLSEEITGIHPTHAQIYAYSLDNKERSLILEEAPDNEENGLSLQIAGIFDDVVYYYKIERSGADGPQKISLYSFNMGSGERLKIFDLEADYDFKLEPIVKTKEYAYYEESSLTGTGTAEYIYFVDNGLTGTSSEDDHAKIYKYNIQSKEVEIFKDKAIDPNICSYKNGIIYYSLGQYCRIYDEKGDRDLEKSDISDKIATARDTIFFAGREGYGEFNTLLGIYDDNLNPRELAVMPSYTLLAVNDNFAKEGGRGLTYLDIQFTSRELAKKPEGYITPYSSIPSDLRANKNIDEALIYDSEADRFSVLELTGGQRVVYAGKIDEGLVIFTANEDYSQVDYYIVAKGDDDMGEAGDEVVEERP